MVEADRLWDPRHKLIRLKSLPKRVAKLRIIAGAKMLSDFMRLQTATVAEVAFFGNCKHCNIISVRKGES